MTKVFKGLVEEGDSYRCDDGPHGAIRIGNVDVVSRLNGVFKKPVIVGVCDELFSGELFIETGWGYSEYTPMDPDTFKVGPHDMVKIIQRHLGKEITLIVSDEPVNILDLPEAEKPDAHV